MRCQGPDCAVEFAPTRPWQRFHMEPCRLRFITEARRTGARRLRRRQLNTTPDPRKVAEILAWAEALKPADPEAWGVPAGGTIREVA